MMDLFPLTQDLSSGKEVKIRFEIFENEMEEAVLTLLSQALAYHHKSYMENIIITIVNELINNAVKANIKRIFFKRSLMNIHESRDYTLLISRFKEEAVERLKSFKQDLKTEGLYVEFYIQFRKEGILIQIYNNTPMTPEEEERAKFRLANASKLNSMLEAFDSFSDDEEGAGLGIILNVQLLKNANIPPENLQILSEKETTVAKLLIPQDLKSPEKLASIQKKLQEEIIELPPFSPNVRKILELTSDPQSNWEEIQTFLELDPVLCSELLKEAVQKSGGTRSFDSLFEACKFLGKPGIFQIVSICSTRRIMEPRYKDFQKFWLQSVLCGYYVRALAEAWKKEVFIERLYLAGIFHNLGKLVLFSLHPDMKNPILNTMMEEIQLGISNIQVGAMVAEKWGYSKELVSLLNNYLCPMTCEPHLLWEACILHVADFLIKSKDPHDRFLYLDLNAANFLGYHSKQEVLDLRRNLDKNYALLSKSL